MVCTAILRWRLIVADHQLAFDTPQAFVTKLHDIVVVKVRTRPGHRESLSGSKLRGHCGIVPSTPEQQRIPDCTSHGGPLNRRQRSVECHRQRTPRQRTARGFQHFESQPQHTIPGEQRRKPGARCGREPRPDRQMQRYHANDFVRGHRKPQYAVAVVTPTAAWSQCHRSDPTHGDRARRDSPRGRTLLHHTACLVQHVRDVE